jgi:hypothetical protein
MRYLESCEPDKKTLFVIPSNLRAGTTLQLKQLLQRLLCTRLMPVKSRPPDVLQTISEIGHEQLYHGAI